MKRISTLLAFLCLITLASKAQAPAEGVNYQAVARDNAGTVITSPITVRMSLLANSPSGTLVYQETHNVTPNQFGLFSLAIGQGVISGGTAGNFANIDWSTGAYFAKTEINTGGSFVNMGTSQLWSVPYALYSKRAANADNAGQNILAGTGIGVSTSGNDVTISTNLGLDGLIDVNTSGAINGNVLQFNGTDWVPGTVTGSGTFNAGPGIDINGTTISALDISPTNEIQNLSLAGNVLGISNGNTVTLPTAINYTAGTGININGSVISSTVTNTDAQTLSINGSNLSISNGNSVTLPTGTTYTAGTGINIAGTVISAVDASATNEIQTLSLVGTTLSISGGNNITLPSGGGTLDNAYNFGGAGAGRTITANSGSVTINGPASNTGNPGIALLVNNAGTNTAAIGAQLTGTGNAINAVSSNASNAYAVIQATTNSNTALNSAVLGQSSGASRGVTGEVLQTGTGGAGVFGNNLRTNGGNGVEGNGFNGVVGVTNYGLGYGVYGINNAAATGTGADLGIGTYGAGFNGVYGQTTNTSIGWAGYFTFDLGVEGTGYATGGWVNASDERLKSKIVPVNNALETLSKIGGKHYTITTPSKDKDGKISQKSREQYGVIAQDIEKILPELVKEKALFINMGDQTQYKTVDYIQLVPIMIEAIKELNTKILVLEAEIKKLKE